MASNSWRNFKFFLNDSIKGPLETQEITSACYGRNCLAVGDSEGMIRIFDRSLRSHVHEFTAFAGPVTHMKFLRSRNILLTIGDDDTINTAILRLWDLDRRDASSGRPYQREHRLFSSKYPAPSETIPLSLNYNTDVMKRVKLFGTQQQQQQQQGVAMNEFRTCVVGFDVTEDLQHAAIGLVNGEIVVIKGDLERERSPKMRRLKSASTKGRLTFVGFPRGAKQGSSATMHSAGDGGAAGALARLGLPFGSGGGAGGGGSGAAGSGAAFAHLLYTVHDDLVTVWRISHKGEYAEYVCEPPMGANYECSALNDEGQLVVASNTTNHIAIFGDDVFLADMARNFDPSMLKPMQYAEVDGDKRKVFFYRHYVVVLTVQNETRQDRFNLQAYDLEHNIRGLNKQQEAFTNVAWLLTDHVDLLVICQEPKTESVQQKITRLTEEEAQAKLEQLFSKECYDIAKKMSRKQLQQSGGDMAQQMNIAKKYGDHLYAKGKFAEAIDQYIEAIGQLEPSYVIRQFLDSQRIHHLTRYLEELHHERHHDHVANKNHTTLLLNCYAKLRDDKKLNAFIHRDDIRFDAHNAIKVCRQAGYYEEATYLAERYQQPSDYVKVHLEHLGKPHRAMQFIKGLSVDDAESILTEHGKELVMLVPDEATDAVIELCTSWRGPPRRRDPHGSSLPATRARAHDLIHVFVDSPQCLLRFLRAVADSSETFRDSGADEDENGTDGRQVVLHTLLELYLTKDLKRSIKHVNPTIATGAGASSGSTSSASYVEPYAKRLDHALSLLERFHGIYDDYHALALVQQHDFEAGVLFLFDRLQLYSEIFTHYSRQFEQSQDPAVRRRAKEKLIHICERQSSSNSGRGGSAPISEESERELWISLLSLLVRSQDDVSDDIARVLERIEQRDLLPPVAVVEILGSNKNLKLRTVRDYVLRMLRKDAEVIDKNQRDIREYTEKTKKITTEIRDLQSSAVVFQTNKCSACNSVMDMPAVHFLCKHSFHQRCLNDVLECNICSAENRRVLQMQRELEEGASGGGGGAAGSGRGGGGGGASSSEFFRALSERTDGVSVVAEYFGRGIFRAPRLAKDALLIGPEGSTFDDRDAPDASPDGLADHAAAGGGGLRDDDLVDDDDPNGLLFGDELENPEEAELW